MGNTFPTLAVALGLLAAPLLSARAPAQEARRGVDKLGVELNKLESFEGGCRSFFLFRNATALSLSSFEMSLAVLDRSGVIDRLLTIDAAPLPAARTTLKLFEIPDISCDAIGEFILHDLPGCAAGEDAVPDCFGIVEISSRAAAPLVK